MNDIYYKIKTKKSFDIGFTWDILFNTEIRIEFCRLADRRTESSGEIDSFLTLCPFGCCENVQKTSIAGAAEWIFHFSHNS